MDSLVQGLMKHGSSFPTVDLAKVCLRGVISDFMDDAFGYPVHSFFLGAVFTSTHLLSSSRYWENAKDI